MAEPLITASKITKDFQGVAALDDVDVRLDRGSVHGIVGPNGAGKTTLLNVLSGFVRPTSGRVEIEGRDVTGLSPQRRVPLGVMRTFQNIRLFGGLTVLENVLVGQHTHSRTGFTLVGAGAGAARTRAAQGRGARARGVRADRLPQASRRLTPLRGPEAGRDGAGDGGAPARRCCSTNRPPG